MRYTGLGMHIKVREITASRAFYEDTLGMVPVFGYGDEEFRATLPSTIPSILDDGLPGAPERYRGVTYEPTATSPLEIADGHIAVPRDERPAVYESAVDGPKVSAMLRAESLVPLLRDKHIVPTFPVRHYYWGTIELALKDPDGFVIIVIAPFSEAELAALREFTNVESIEP